jgi:hypothetical protein
MVSLLVGGGIARADDADVIRRRFAKYDKRQPLVVQAPDNDLPLLAVGVPLVRKHAGQWVAKHRRCLAWVVSLVESGCLVVLFQVLFRQTLRIERDDRSALLGLLAPRILADRMQIVPNRSA